MQKTKIILSKEELHLLNDSSVWNYKRSLTGKLYELLAECKTNIQKRQEEAFRTLIITHSIIPSKISRGENYLGNPYVILDYPNVYSKEGILAIRTMFWFGEVLSCSMIVSGSYLGKYSHIIQSNLSSVQHKKLYFCIADDPWDHHFDKSNMKKLEVLSKAQMQKQITGNSFIKIATKTSIEKPKNWKGFILDSYEIFVGLMRE